jgi:hypothetical protein
MLQSTVRPAIDTRPRTMMVYSNVPSVCARHCAATSSCWVAFAGMKNNPWLSSGWARSIA